jgi:hypothetical protein
LENRKFGVGRGFKDAGQSVGAVGDMLVGRKSVDVGMLLYAYNMEAFYRVNQTPSMKSSILTLLNLVAERKEYMVPRSFHM